MLWLVLKSVAMKAKRPPRFPYLIHTCWSPSPAGWPRFGDAGCEAIMSRNMAIWISGLLAAGSAGGALGKNHGYDGAVWGFLWGAFAFTCVRLWIALERSGP